jgi:hypothetical protein
LYPTCSDAVCKANQPACTTVMVLSAGWSRKTGL